MLTLQVDKKDLPYQIRALEFAKTDRVKEIGRAINHPPEKDRAA
jgi:hypothetical protein